MPSDCRLRDQLQARTAEAAARAQAQAVEEAAAAREAQAHAREERCLRVAEEAVAEQQRAKLSAEEDRQASVARRESLLGRGGILKKLQEGQEDRRAARLAGLSTLAQSPRGGCKASAETFDEGMRQLSEAAGASSITAGLGFGGSAQLRSLSGLRISGLAERARECGVEREALDDALEGEAPKAAVIQLILAAKQAQLEMG